MPYIHHESDAQAIIAASSDPGTYHGGSEHSHGRVYWVRIGNVILREVHSDAGRTLESSVYGTVGWCAVSGEEA